MLTPGKILQNRRKELKKSLFVVSQETKIQERFLRYIEADDYSKFDSGIFVNGFIKIYADYLGLDVERMLALYRRASKQVQTKGPLTFKKQSFDFKSLITPVNIAILIVALAILAGVIYLGGQFYKFQKAPNVEIISPSTDTIVESNTVSVLGVADQNSEVFLNGEQIEIDENGSFNKDLILDEGVNTISVEAINPNSNQKTVEAIKIEYQKPEVKKENKTTEKKKTFTGKLEVISGEASVDLEVDDKVIFNQVVQPGTTETFEIKDSLYLSSWRIEYVKLYINNKEYPLLSKGGEAIPSMSCTVQNNTINCSQ